MGSYYQIEIRLR